MTDRTRDDGCWQASVVAHGRKSRGERTTAQASAVTARGGSGGGVHDGTTTTRQALMPRSLNSL